MNHGKVYGLSKNLFLRSGQQMLIDSIPGANGQPHVRLVKASHFFQDDQGAEIARRIVEFIEANPIIN